MFLIIGVMALFHWIMSLLWFVCNAVDVKKDYTSQNIEFERCQYPLSKHMRYETQYILWIKRI